MLKFRICIFLLLLSFKTYTQSNEEGQRIAELYSYLEDNHSLFGQEVLIYDYKIKSKKLIKDSTLVARLTIVNDDYQKTYDYDTNQYEVIKYELADGKRIPNARYIHNENWKVTELAVINETYQLLSNTFYKYEGGKLISEEAFTGYAYLDNPRKISVITYKYDGNKLIERDKKYSLNGIHWIQTWVSKFDNNGNCYYQETTDNDIKVIEQFAYDEHNRLILSEIQQAEKRTKIKEITYNGSDAPKSVWVYDKKSNKTERLTKYFYQ